MPGQLFIDLQGHYYPGGEVGFGSYQAFGYWKVALEGIQHRAFFNNEANDELNYAHLFADGEYMLRLLSTYSRSVSIYAGVGAFLGMEVVDPWKTVPSNVYWEHEKTAFMYGVVPKLEAELYVGSRVSFLITGQAPGSALLFALVVLQALAGAPAAKKVPVTLGSQYRQFSFVGGVGLRIAI